MWSWSTLFDQKTAKYFRRRQKLTTFVVIGVLNEPFQKVKLGKPLCPNICKTAHVKLFS